MPEGERVSFEKKLAEDPALSNLVEETKLTNEALHFAHLSVLKESIGRDITNIPHNSNGGLKKAVILSASLLLLGTTGYVLTQNNKPDNAAKTYVFVDSSQYISEVVPQKDIKFVETPKIDSSSQEETETPKNTAKAPVTTAEVKEIITSKEDTLTEDSSDVKTKKEVSLSVEKENTKPQPVIEKDIIAVEKTTVPITCDKTFEISSSPSCKEEATGAIIINTEYKEDYIFLVDGYKKQFSGGKIINLSAGEHNLVINYAECTYKKTVSISEKWCALNESFSFNPDYGEKWNIQYEDGDQGTFNIYNARGREVYKANFGAGNEYWDGIDLSGNIAPVGNYFVMIKYSDSRIEKVELTIVR